MLEKKIKVPKKVLTYYEDRDVYDGWMAVIYTDGTYELRERLKDRITPEAVACLERNLPGILKGFNVRPVYLNRLERD